MGDEMVIIVSVVDDDETSDFVVIGHAVLAEVGSAVAGYFLGPAGGAAVRSLSGKVQSEITKGGERDHLGTLTVTLPRTAADGSTFGLAPNEHSKIFERQAGNVWIKYTVLRIAKSEDYNDWCVSVTLNKFKMVDDSDDLTQGAGEVYIRPRVADGFVTGEIVKGQNASQLNQKTTTLPTRSYTKDVHTGDFFPIPREGVKLYFNTTGSGRNARCKGLPVFLFIEVDVFEDDSQLDCSGRTCDDVLGVLPLMFTHQWLREHQVEVEIKRQADGSACRRLPETNLFNQANQ